MRRRPPRRVRFSAPSTAGTWRRWPVTRGALKRTLPLDGAAVGHYATRAAAEAAVAKGVLPSDAALVLVRDEFDPADAIGFAAYAPSSRNGVVGLSETYAALVCTGA